ncbi:MAG: PHP domain-containing protein [Clostridiaceae bacterium]|nr:PHP domain-containing protein [Clostridiaceae bacterium]
MKYWVDLHIHSCLSPCAEEDMTPNNIVNMALIKGLDIIAVTDHNSTGNLQAVIEVGNRQGLLVIPGMELCTAEEIHLVCLFPELDKAQTFEKLVYDNLSPMKNREDIFGSQILMDNEDNEIGRESRLLSGASMLDTETALKSVRNLNGVVIPAHVNRQSYSMLNTLGAIPPEYGFKYLELSKNCVFDEFIKENPSLNSYQYIRTSDSHFLCDLLEQEVALELEEKTIESLLAALKVRQS